MTLGEDRLVEWLRRRLRAQGEDLLGDDAARLDRAERWAVSVDQQIEGVHFPTGLDPRVVGARLVAVCLSDLAASGALPAYGFLTMALPRAYPAKRLLTGVLAACRRFTLTLAGGDTASAVQHLSLGLTVLGRRPPRGRWLTRGAARPGDGLWLGGAVGESALGRHLIAAGAGLVGRSVVLPERFSVSDRMLRAGRRAVRRHLAPVPQLGLGAALARRRRVAALDVSDGLAIDLHRLCAASGVGAELDSKRIPRPRELEPWAQLLGESDDELTLAGGEDYVLLFTLPKRVTRSPWPGCRRIGRITDRSDRGHSEVRLHGEAGSRLLAPSGWDHLR